MHVQPAVTDNRHLYVHLQSIPPNDNSAHVSYCAAQRSLLSEMPFTGRCGRLRRLSGETRMHR
jgi:hypothetical protein